MEGDNGIGSDNERRERFWYGMCIGILIGFFAFGFTHVLNMPVAVSAIVAAIAMLLWLGWFVPR